MNMKKLCFLLLLSATSSAMASTLNCVSTLNLEEQIRVTETPIINGEAIAQESENDRLGYHYYYKVLVKNNLITHMEIAHADGESGQNKKPISPMALTGSYNFDEDLGITCNIID